VALEAFPPRRRLGFLAASPDEGSEVDAGGVVAGIGPSSMGPAWPGAAGAEVGGGGVATGALGVGTGGGGVGAAAGTAGGAGAGAFAGVGIVTNSPGLQV